MTDSKNKTVTSLNLFLIGLSAGFIATSLPRLAPYLTQDSNTVSIELFTIKYLIVALLFSLIIGISMIWLYKGTKEHTKVLFLSALALPSILSGTLNTTNLSSISTQKIAELDSQTKMLQNKLETQNSIESIELDLNEIQFTPLSYLPNIIGISTVYAEENSLLKKKESGSQITNIKAYTLDKKFVLMFGVSTTKAKARAKITKLKNLNLTNISPYTINNKIYLLQNKRLTKTNALLEAIKIKKKYNMPVRIVNLK